MVGPEHFTIGSSPTTICPPTVAYTATIKSPGSQLSPPSYYDNSGNVELPSRIESQLRCRNQVLVAEAERARQQFQSQQLKI